jgi:hypothetical protein
MPPSSGVISRRMRLIVPDINWLGFTDLAVRWYYNCGPFFYRSSVLCM